MKNNLLPICLVAAALCCGCNGKRENTTREYVPNNPELIRRIECAAQSMHEHESVRPQVKMPSDSLVMQMFNAIVKRDLPETPEGIFSSATMQLCRDAWAVPNDAFGDLGTNDDELNYILMGMEEDSLVAEKVVVYRSGDSTLAKIFITPFNRGHEYPQKRTRNFHLVEENGRWVIDDFDTWYGFLKQHLHSYIEKQRKKFRSEEWKAYVERMKGDYDSIVVQNSLQEIEEYFRKYPDMPSDSTVARMFNTIAKREFSAAAEDVLSSSMFQIYRDTWAVPNDGFCNMCCGDDGPNVAFLGPKEIEDSLAIEKIDIDLTSAKVYVTSYLEGHEKRERRRRYTFHLIAENGRWVIDDCDDVSISHTSGDMKQLFHAYINEHREYLRSDDWKDYIEKERKSAEKCENADEREQWLQSIDESVKAVDEYFRKYPD